MDGQEKSIIARDTIAAVSTGTQAAAIAVIRVSGPEAGTAVRALAGRVPEPRRALLSRLRHPVSGERLDEGLVLWFPGPASATGEDMAEFHIHGGRAVIAAVLDALFAVPGIVPAERGDFTRRAYLNGKMDLTEAEGLADLIAAETEAQRRQALAHTFGHLGREVTEWRARLIRAMALVEAGIDFADEDDVPAEARALARPEVVTLLGELEAALTDRRGAMVREGAVIAIAGRPNAGKSSMMNALALRDVAIVSDEPGTTRDVLEVGLDLSGYKATLIDTAGLREAAGKVEAEGIRRAHQRIAEADLVLWVHDATEPEPPELTIDSAAEFWLLANKADIAQGVSLPETTRTTRRFRLSAKNGDGLDELTSALEAFIAERARGGEHPSFTRARQREAAGRAAEHLQIALASWEDLSEELLAEELRLAAGALASITGRIGVEDLLDVVFREFCIGK